VNNDRPIGIFDSGIGGLTVANAIQRLLPNESLVYYGDTAHLPYGDKSKELIAHYAVTITKFLLNEKKCKAIVIACNTASAAAYEALRDAYKGSVPVINVIDPMIEEVIADENIHKVGIIATKTTVTSGVYQEKFSRRKPNLQHSALATPLLASMIEEGFYNNTISEAVLNEYLSNPALAQIDGLVLACTHYPRERTITFPSAQWRKSVLCVGLYSGFRSRNQDFFQKRNSPRALSTLIRGQRCPTPILLHSPLIYHSSWEKTCVETA